MPTFIEYAGHAEGANAALDYMARGPGVTADATRWLFEQGVRVMGIDA